MGPHTHVDELLTVAVRADDAALAHLAGVARPAVAQTPRDLVWRRETARLWRYRSEDRRVRAPILLVHSLVSKSYILDLLPGNSISDDQLRAAVDANSFQALSGGREPGAIDANSNLRRGQAGSWRDELAPEVSERFTPEDRELLESLGYGG